MWLNLMKYGIASSDEGLLLWAHFRRVQLYTKTESKVCIHPKSVNSQVREFDYKWLIYHLKMKTSNVSRRGLIHLLRLLPGPAFNG